MNKKCQSYFVLSSLSIFLITKTSVVTNLKPFNWANKSTISLLLIADSVSLSCSSGLKEYKILTLKELAKPLKVCARFVILTVFLLKIFFTFFVSRRKELLEPTWESF